MGGFINLLKKTVEYILPKRCFSCAEFIQGEDGFCGSCWQKFNFITSPFCKTCGTEFELRTLEAYSNCLKCISSPPAFDRARAIFKFDENSKNIIHAFKYYDKTVLAKQFAKMLCERYANEMDDASIIVPVPMYRFKRLFRMYNPPQMIANSISKRTGIEVVADLLSKVKWTKSQTKLSRKERIANISASIQISGGERVKGKKVILVDDVITTGTTINHCAKILKKAGAKEVLALSIAIV